MKKSILLALVLALIVGCNDPEKRNASPTGGGGAGGSGGAGGKGEQVEGVVNGGGGKGVKCIGEDGVSTHEVLDIYEGHYVYDRSYDEISRLSAEALREEMVERVVVYSQYPQTPITETDRDAVREAVQEFLDGIRFIKKNQSLKITNDADEPLMEDGCELTQIAVYYDESSLLIDKKYWDELDEFNQLALLYHEMVYLWQRLETGVETSIESRRMIAYLFADQDLEPLYTQELLDAAPEDIGYCFEVFQGQGSEFGFYLLKQPNGGVKIVFDDFQGSTPLFATVSEVRSMSFEAFTSTSRPADGSVDSLQTGLTDFFNTRMDIGTMTINMAAQPAQQIEFSYQEKRRGKPEYNYSTTMQCSQGAPVWEDF